MRPARPGVLVLAAVLTLGGAGAASAAWSSSARGSTTVAARQLPLPATSATCVDPTSLDVSWTTSASAPVVQSFLVERTIDGGATWTAVTTVTATTATSYTHSETALVAGTYAYRVRADNGLWRAQGPASATRTLTAAGLTGPKASRPPATCA